MHRTYRPVLAAIAVGFVMLGAGCGGSVPRAPAAESGAAAPGANPGATWIDTIWPAIVVIGLAAAIIAAIVFCKPLGLCWERPPGGAGGAGGAADTR